jgi:hypothetical protein
MNATYNFCDDVEIKKMYVYMCMFLFISWMSWATSIVATLKRTGVMRSRLGYSVGLLDFF